MTVHNITKLLDRKTQLAIKAFLNVNKITVTYSEWLNDFGIRTEEACKPERHLIAVNKIRDMFGGELISTLTACPKIDHAGFKAAHGL